MFKICERREDDKERNIGENVRKDSNKKMMGIVRKDIQIKNSNE